MLNTCLCIFQEEMTNALATMRVDYDQINIKNLDESENPILKKRRKKMSNPTQPPLVEETMETK